MVEKVHGRTPTTEIKKERKKSNGTKRVKETRRYTLPKIGDVFGQIQEKKKEEEQLQATLLPSPKI